MSLRTRLIAGVLAIAAIGLLVAGGVTYAEQRSFLVDRIDRQSAAALNAVDHRLNDALIGESGSPYDFDPPPGAAPGGRPRGAGGPNDLVNLPPGTYGIRLAADGSYGTGIPLFLNGQTPPSPPRLPTNLHDGETLNVKAQDGGLRYRVYVRQDPGSIDGALTVAAIPLTEVDSTLNRLLVIEGIVIAVVLAALAAASFLMVRLGLRPLDRIGATADAIAAGDLSRRVTPATSKTEVGRLGLALNAMLARLEHAFTRQRASEDRLRTFLADASHELRTPLASIRGYAELFRIGAARNPDDIAKAMTRIEQEATRMGVLVDDLLTLARLDELPVLDQQLVDLSALARDAVHDARATAPDRKITVEAPAPATVCGEPHQLRQVYANLLRNALVHTPAGTAIDVAVTEEDTDVVLTVRDHGPGLPGDGTDAIFERFWRTEPGRGRGKAGAGLGLAIVAGIVGAHGGQVAAANAPDGGAVFTVRLPQSVSLGNIEDTHSLRSQSGDRMPT
ncbi:HAMP domain-containing histidine kinase [Paraconexibacter antarcticus]|uniref:histidine kinase n=1 Tax=Paraconexibacter antarcticus TaxID=2949664 RepID=A0ABY5DVZ5_9ACTN|nr:HAMP domain-containing sensor histidine kinase [Paraconexibacter antarcticus]UTI65099.1 HAMP domain-containing histidine kinase [Paraconexibacter antarcticus]